MRALAKRMRGGAARRAAPLGVVLGTAAAITSAGTADATDADAAGVHLTNEEQSFVQAVNATRAQYKLPALRVSTTLTRAARAHSVDMIRRRYFAHGDFRNRLLRFGVRTGRIGEDLGWSIDDEAAIQRVVAMWLASPRHRYVLLLPSFRRLGIGVAEGPFKDHPDTVVVTADFQGR
jgi:uncharacterized protein YkwD